MDYKKIFGVVTIPLVLAGCLSRAPVAGNDKQAMGMLRGVAVGAGAGAVTGAQIAAAAGPGVAIGAGLGGVAGAISGALSDMEEEEILRLQAELEAEQARVQVHQVLANAMRRRIAMHPTREIYPADLFFSGDETTLCKQGEMILKELARLNKDRKPWSRLVVTSYAKSVDPESVYAQRLTSQRAKQIGDALIRYGIEPHRIKNRTVIIDAPLLVDPNDAQDRYSQAVEFALIDK